MISSPFSHSRVVVTGMGILAPNGNDISTFWESISEGRTGIDTITRFDPSGLDCRIAGEIKGFNPEAYIDHRLKPERRMARATQYAIACARMGLQDAGLHPRDLKGSEPVPIILGVSTSAMDIIEQAPKPWTPIATCPHSVTSSIAYTTGLQARLWTISDGCTSGMDAIRVGMMEIKSGACDVAIVGASDSAITRYTLESFTKSKKLSCKNDSPGEACRPFDLSHDGGVLSEGAGVVILENLVHARARGREPYAEVIGCGMSADPPDTLEASGLEFAMRHAMANARCRPEEIDYINAHAPGDPEIDRMESRLIREIFGDVALRTPVSSIKGCIGNPMAASSIHQFIASALIMHHQTITPTANLETPDPECLLDHVTRSSYETPLRTILVNSHGFGRGNNSIVIRACEPDDWD